MPLSTEVGIDPGDIVLDGDSAPHGKGIAAPLFSARVYRGPNGRPSQQLLRSCSVELS